MKTEALKETFTKRYILALFLVALLATAAFFILHMALKSSDSTAYIINVAGKQRMLSQRIASLSQQYHLQCYFHKVSANENALLKSTLTLLIQEMRQANTSLSSGEIATNTSALETLYFGTPNLAKRVETYLSLSEEVLEAKSQNPSHTLLSELLHYAETLLPDLNTAVELYQKEGETKIALIKNLELGAWILTLTTLLLEIIFIFQPMAHAIKTLFLKTSWQYHELEQQVKARTLDLEQTNQKLSHLASHDPLTGLKNRLHLEDELDRLMLHYKINHLPYAVAMLDVDWFKKVNDTYGHDAGDFVLCELSKLFVSTVRQEDTIFRSGGEEFVIIFNRIKQEDVFNRCELIRQRVEAHTFVYKGDILKITISGGVYHPDDKEVLSVREVLKHADNALYLAKSKGRNRIVMH